MHDNALWILSLIADNTDDMMRKYNERIGNYFGKFKIINMHSHEINYNDVVDHSHIIDGLNTEKSYVRNAFEKLKHKTIIDVDISQGVRITFIFYHNKTTEHADLMRKCINRTHCMLNIFGENINIYHGSTINILLYHAPRIMTIKYNDIVGDNFYFNCTCGYAERKNGKFNVFVTRSNGCLGLLVHELGHTCGLDTLSQKDHKGRRYRNWHRIVPNFDVSSDCKIGEFFEGLNNGNSAIIHSMFEAWERDGGPHEFRKYYMDELIHSINMTNRLLRWFDYNSLSELLIRDNAKYTQKSQLLEYILIKCVYLINFQKLNSFTTNYNDDEYMEQCIKKMVNTMRLIDSLRSEIAHDTDIIGMEYYFHK